MKNVASVPFDYIVVNYEWTDGIYPYGEGGPTICEQNFDCVMYFDTKSIGDMYQKCANGDPKTMTINDIDVYGSEQTYGELAFNQGKSVVDDVDRVESQVIYLSKLQKDGYLRKITDANDDTLTIQLYGIWCVPSDQFINSYNINISINAYSGGVMEKDYDTQTIKNVGGTEIKVDGLSGKYIDTLKKQDNKVGKT